MIEVIYSSEGIFVFDVNHWATLRKQHRIIGDIIGNTAFVPALPVKLLPEEALLLVERGIVHIKEINNFDCDAVLGKQKIDEFESDLLQAQIVEYKKIRRIQLESVIDKIVEKRRKLNDVRPAEEILNEELEKSTVINRNNMIWPILLQPIHSVQSTARCIGVEDISKLTTNLKCRVYHDLWEKGYYITQGGKFGGDYLVYLGDPICYHAIFIVRCVELEESISPSEIVAFGRLGTSVRKRAVLASVLDDQVSYVTINWIDS